jgi:hypothetical protein
MSTEQRPPQQRKPLRFRLGTMLLVLGLALVTVSHVYTSVKLRQANESVKQLREEVGYLDIEDPTKVHVLALETTEPDTWRWRVYIPKGNTYAWRLASENLPRTGLPDGGTSGISNENYSARDNEMLVTAALHQRPHGIGELVVTSRISGSRDQMSDATHRIAADSFAWRETTPGQERDVLGERTTAILDPAGPIVLLKVRALEKQSDSSFQPSTKPMPGIAVWLEPRP